YSFTFGIDFNTVAIPLPDNVEDRESILNEHEKKFGTLSMLDKNHALAIMATEDNNRYTALSHWRMLLAKYDACNGTDLLRQIDQKKLVVVQTDHKVLSENAISKITLGRTLEEGLLKPTAVRNSLQLIKELALAGVSILHGPSPLNSLAKGLRVPNTERPKQGVLLTNAPIDGEVGLLVIGKDMDEVRDQIAKIEAWAGAGKLAEVL
ncbi:MAG: hypothetical protein KDD62_16205, partial [Bdellovibrionales bacterium]|nr:hypothetical protein [Bdellovibrionales bacterium]